MAAKMYMRAHTQQRNSSNEAASNRDQRSMHDNYKPNVCGRIALMVVNNCGRDSGADACEPSGGFTTKVDRPKPRLGPWLSRLPRSLAFDCQ